MSKPTGARRITTAIIVDMMGSGDKSREDEIAYQTTRFARLLAPAELVIHTPYHAGTGGKAGIKESTELIIYDFGGMMPGSSLMEDNARMIVQWAEDHPNGLVVVVSSFTYTRFIQYELQERGLTLFNIVHDDSLKEDNDATLIPEWFTKVK